MITDEKKWKHAFLFRNDRSYIFALFHQLSCCVKLQKKFVEESGRSRVRISFQSFLKHNFRYLCVTKTRKSVDVGSIHPLGFCISKNRAVINLRKLLFIPSLGH